MKWFKFPEKRPTKSGLYAVALVFPDDKYTVLIALWFIDGWWMSPLHPEYHDGDLKDVRVAGWMTLPSFPVSFFPEHPGLKKKTWVIDPAKCFYGAGATEKVFEELDRFI